MMPNGKTTNLLQRSDIDALGALVFTPNEKTLAAGDGSNTIRLLEIASREVRASLNGHSANPTGLAVTADSKILASRDWAGEVLLWDLPSGKEFAAVSPYTSPKASAVTITPDGRTLVTGGDDGTLRLWDVSQLRRRYEQVQAWTKSPPGFSAAEAAEMRKRIAALATVSRSDFGLPHNIDGYAFAPLPGAYPISQRLDSEDQVKPFPAVLELIRLGPKAIPFLVNALDDRRPTNLVVKLNLTDRSGAMRVHPFTVCIGDVCYVVLCQIVGEQHLPLTPFGHSGALWSPTGHPGMLRGLRLRWASDDAPKQLLDKLMKDYQTKLKFNGENLNDWDTGLRMEAAMRLLYYFPHQTAPLIAERLARFDVAATGKTLDAWMKREVANGAHAEDFIKAVGWSKEPAIQKALCGIVERATDPSILLAAISAAEGVSKARVRERIESLLDKLPKEEGRGENAGYALLVALGKRFGEDAKPAFVRYLTNASLQRKWTMCRVLYETNGAWAVELLGPLLTDKRTGYGRAFAAVPGNPAELLETRLCDEAASVISAHNPDLRFTLAGQYADLDRQIDLMRQHLARRKR
jgi:hypothetical protein